MKKLRSTLFYTCTFVLLTNTLYAGSSTQGELIEGGGNANGIIDKSKWSFYGETYHQQSRTYQGKRFIYSTPKDIGSGMSQSFSTQIGKTYQVSAILIGSDTNRQERFNGYSYLTISNHTPTQNGSNIIAESQHIEGDEEIPVDFTFTADSTTSYLALRSDNRWHYANARAISVKEVTDNQPITPPQQADGKPYLIGHGLTSNSSTLKRSGIILDADTIWYRGDYYMSHDPIHSDYEARTKQRLSDFIQYVKDTGATVTLQVKTGNASEYASVIEIVNQVEPNPSQIIYTVTDMAIAEKVHDLSPHTKIFFWQENPSGILNQLERDGNPYNISIVGFESRYKSYALSRVKRLGLKVALLHDGNYPGDYLLEGADYIISRNALSYMNNHSDSFNRFY